MSATSKYISSLDGLRAFAVISVMLIHFGVFNLGWVGVQVFFVLSGYLITNSLLLDKERAKSLKGYLKVFYWKRSLRIFPIYFLYIAVFLFACYLLSDVNRIEKLLLPLITYTVNIYALTPERVDLDGVGHFWSLAVEEQFYLIWPFVVYYLSYKNFKIVLYALIVSIPVLRAVMGFMVDHYTGDKEYMGLFINLCTLSHFDAFAVGSLITLTVKNGLVLSKKILISAIVVSLLLFFSIGFINVLASGPSYVGKGFLAYSSFGFPWLLIENYGYIWGYTIINLIAGLIIFSVVKFPDIIPVFKYRVGIYIGKISYGIYLFHVPVLLLLSWMKEHQMVSHPAIRLALFFVLTIGIASLSYFTIESYFMRMKKHIVY